MQQQARGQQQQRFGDLIMDTNLEDTHNGPMLSGADPVLGHHQLSPHMNGSRVLRYLAFSGPYDN